MEPRCEETRGLAAELALGIVEGEERGRALEHLAVCPECRRRVEQLSEVADELLLLAPAKEVPVGFESARWRRSARPPSPGSAVVAGGSRSRPPQPRRWPSRPPCWSSART